MISSTGTGFDYNSIREWLKCCLLLYKIK
jgi:hypothetical protein